MRRLLFVSEIILMASSPVRSAPLMELRLAELLSALSCALDMVEGQPPGHCARCYWIGIHIGREIGLCESEIWELHYTLLVKNVGCSSNAARRPSACPGTR
jgi:hypothetical protein